MTNTESVVLSKVPEVTIGFWIIKIFATTLGEVGGNAVTMQLGFGYLIGSALFAAVLMVLVAAQILAKEFRPFLYWAVIVATTLTGTALADFFDRSLGIGYLGGSLSLFSMVMMTIGLWYWTLGSVFVQTIASPKVEAFYWTTIMFSQTWYSAWRLDGGYRIGLQRQRARDRACARRTCRFVLLYRYFTDIPVLGRVYPDPSIGSQWRIPSTSRSIKAGLP